MMLKYVLKYMSLQPIKVAKLPKHEKLVNITVKICTVYKS